MSLGKEWPNPEATRDRRGRIVIFLYSLFEQRSYCSYQHPTNARVSRAVFAAVSTRLVRIIVGFHFVLPDLPTFRDSLDPQVNFDYVINVRGISLFSNPSVSN